MNYVQYDEWLKEQGRDGTWIRVESTMGLYAAVRAGAERAVLPCYLGDADADLCRCGAIIEGMGIPLWLLVHPDLKRVSRVRALLDFLGAEKSLRDRL